jgi:hypothetical protein
MFHFINRVLPVVPAAAPARKATLSFIAVLF